MACLNVKCVCCWDICLVSSGSGMQEFELHAFHGKSDHYLQSFKRVIAGQQAAREPDSPGT